MKTINKTEVSNEFHDYCDMLIKAGNSITLVNEFITICGTDLQDLKDHVAARNLPTITVH